MAIPLRVAFCDVTPSPALEEFARHWAIKLEHFHPWIESCDVVIDRPVHLAEDTRMHVRVTVAVAGPDVVVSREQAQTGEYVDAFVAIRDAFRAARSQLTDQFRRRATA